MPTLRATVTIRVDGKLLAGFPFTRRLETPTESQMIDLPIQGGGTSTIAISGVPVGTAAAVAALPSGLVTVQVQNQTTGLWVLEGGGLALYFKIAGTSGVPFMRMQNDAAASVRVRGCIAGS